MLGFQSSAESALKIPLPKAVIWERLTSNGSEVWTMLDELDSWQHKSIVCFSGVPSRAGNQGWFSGLNMFPMQTVTECPQWPITQTQVYLGAYHPARGPHTVLPLSAWLCCRYWHSQSIATSRAFICWLINSSHLSDISERGRATRTKRESVLKKTTDSALD